MRIPNTPMTIENAATAGSASISAAHDASVDALAASLKQRLNRKAFWGSGASLIPLPFLDVMVDMALLSNMLNDIHQAFGLTPQQLEALEPNKRQKTFAAIQWVGNKAIGKLVTTALVKTLLVRLGVHLTAGQLSKVVPVVGQIASASLNYAAMRHLITRHIDDCVKVVKQAQR
jgi:uncharacterized protein (DUF697 family)